VDGEGGERRARGLCVCARGRAGGCFRPTSTPSHICHPHPMPMHDQGLTAMAHPGRGLIAAHRLCTYLQGVMELDG
jgi:hypothetical protein